MVSLPAKTKTLLLASMSNMKIKPTIQFQEIIAINFYTLRRLGFSISDLNCKI